MNQRAPRNAVGTIPILEYRLVRISEHPKKPVREQNPLGVMMSYHVRKIDTLRPIKARAAIAHARVLCCNKPQLFSRVRSAASIS